MIFITGPLFAGKQAYIMKTLGLSEKEWEERGVRDVEELCREKMSEEELSALAGRLSQKEIVIATEVGGGVVPLSAQERLFREQAGRLSCLLAERAQRVIRVICGLPQELK